MTGGGVKPPPERLEMKIYVLVLNLSIKNNI